VADHTESDETVEPSESAEPAEPAANEPAETPTSTPAAASNGPSPAFKMLTRYGPFLLVAILVVAAIAVFGGKGGDDDDDAGTGGGSNNGSSEDDLIRSGPMTPARADLEGKTDVDFGPNCDSDTGLIKMPTVYAPPCVQPFEGDNGGATSQGVTGDSIKVIAYVLDPAVDPLGAAALGGAGANLDPEVAANTMRDYVALYDTMFETYGRKIDFETFTGTGQSDDQEAARADAIAIAEKKPFAVLGGPGQAREVFIEELTAQGVLCPPGCAVAQNETFIKDHEPYLWTLGPTSNEAAELGAEAIANLAGPGKAELAGDDATKAKDRVYALVHYDTPDGDQTETFEAMRDALSDQGIELETDIKFFLDFDRIQETARTIVNQLEDAGVTTVIFIGDPVTPGALTIEATAQGFNPEWILGPNVLADTAYFARQFDQEQWSHGFGIAFATTPAVDEISDSYLIYDWAYGHKPESNIYGILAPPLQTLYTGIQMAGEDLTPESFGEGLRRLPIAGGGPTRQQVSYGDHGVWPEFDYGSSDDISIIWWDPRAEGIDEIGQQGFGMYRFANGGKRYTIGHLPKSLDEAGLFDDAASAVQLTELPDEDKSPDYPPPDL
jgi:hypothetical protein